MKKLILTTAVVAAAGAGFSSSASAALANGDTLNFDPGVTGGYYGFVTGGSYFAMDTNGDGIFKASERTAIAQNDGLAVGTIQNATGSHSGAPDGSESPGIDAPWNFFGNTGMHGSSVATDIISAAGNTATLDFSGWYVTWSGIPVIDMGSGASNGVASIACGVDCSLGDTYTLTYGATVPVGDPSGFGGVSYQLNMVGTIGEQTAVIPVPAAVWLFGSGLLGLVGVARRRKAG